jgi:cyanate lyase
MKIGERFKAIFEEYERDPEFWAADASLGFTLALQQRMKQIGMSKADLARSLDTSQAYVTKLFRGQTNYTVVTMVKLAHAVGCR